MNISFLIKDKAKFLQIKQETIRQKSCNNMNRHNISAYVHLRRDTFSPIRNFMHYG